LNLFLVLVTAHVCGDVLTYSTLLARAKRSGSRFARAKAVALHCLIHAFFVLILGWLFGIKGAVVAAGYIFVVHFMIDFVRVQTELRLFDPKCFIIINKRQVLEHMLRRYGKHKEFETFMKKYFWKWGAVNILDQTLHLVSIAVFVLLVRCP
jgi:hypothetical protein